MILLSTLSPRDRRAVILGATLVLVLLAARFLFAPWLGHWGKCRQEIDSGQAGLEILQMKSSMAAAKLNELSGHYGIEMAKALEDPQATSIRFLNKVPEAIKKAGIQIQNIQPQPVKVIKELPATVAVPFQIKANCQLPQVAQCLEALTRLDMLIIVDQLTMSGNDKNPGQLEVTLVLTSLAKGASAR